MESKEKEIELIGGPSNGHKMSVPIDQNELRIAIRRGPMLGIGHAIYREQNDDSKFIFAGWDDRSVN